MKQSIVVAAVAFLPLFAAPAWANEAHHPAQAASSSTPLVKSAGKQTAPAGQAPAAMPPMKQMDEQMKKMQEMHDKMMAAKTPEERQKLMDEQMKLMQEGMAMSKGMGGMMGSHGMGMMGEQTSHSMMMKRMEMMEMMMQMMMDREAGRMPMTP